jgi:phosphatidylglycerol---prolipoprotein diacylglyceryl transferase
MYPILWEPFGFPISTFGVMMALGFLAATSITARRMKEVGLDPEYASTMLLYCMLGGVLGAKLYYALDEGLRTGTPIASLLFSRSGITWYGGLIGGTLAAVLGCRVHGIPVRLYAEAVCVGAAVGQTIGRIGCFLVGDDYGRPSTLPWAVAFPRGLPPTDVPVHPTQLYEAIPLVGLAVLLTRLRAAGTPDRRVFGIYLLLAGLLRFAIEFLRVDERVLLGLSVAHLASLGAMAAGAALLARRG